jgi:hypothetical protein
MGFCRLPLASASSSCAADWSTGATSIIRAAIDGTKKSEQEEDRIVKRLERVEQRLTEVQDVMIALSEKIDYMDGMGAKPWSTKKADGKKS